MGRKRKKNGTHLTAYISQDINARFEEKIRKMGLNKSDAIEYLVRSSLDGKDEFLRVAGEYEKLKKEYKTLHDEKARLEKENEKLQKKIERLEKENEELKAKWKGQTTLKKYDQKSMEIKAIAERLIEHIEVGKTWREVAKEAGFIFPGDQLDILKKVFQKEGCSFKSEFIPGWKLTEGANTTQGYFGYIFKREEDGHAHALTRRVAEVNT